VETKSKKDAKEKQVSRTILNNLRVSLRLVAEALACAKSGCHVA